MERPAVRQKWRLMTFLHWPYEPDDIRPLLPAGLEPDLFDGRAWVSLTPFLVQDFQVLDLPPVPILSTFPETNVRTYVRAADGLDGLWFLGLEVDSIATTVGARLGLGVPYNLAHMSVDDGGDRIRYRSRRRPGDGPGHDIEVVPGQPFEDGELGPLDHWLTGRWRAYSEHAGHLLCVAVEHEPWPLVRADVPALEEDLLTSAGLPAPTGPPVVHWSTGVDAALGNSRRID